MSATMEPSSTPWVKSSYSGEETNCVEAAHLDTRTALRDSRHPEHGHLSFPRAEWTAFLTQVARDG